MVTMNVEKARRAVDLLVRIGDIDEALRWVERRTGTLNVQCGGVGVVIVVPQATMDRALEGARRDMVNELERMGINVEKP